MAKLKLDLHDIYNDSRQLDLELQRVIDEALRRKISLVEIIPGKGSHIKARNAKGFAVIPNHPGDLPTGTRRAIIKSFAAMGVAILALLAILTLLF